MTVDIVSTSNHPVLLNIGHCCHCLTLESAIELTNLLQASIDTLKTKALAPENPNVE